MLKANSIYRLHIDYIIKAEMIIQNINYSELIQKINEKFETNYKVRKISDSLKSQSMKNRMIDALNLNENLKNSSFAKFTMPATVTLYQYIRLELLINHSDMKFVDCYKKMGIKVNGHSLFAKLRKKQPTNKQYTMIADLLGVSEEYLKSFPITIENQPMIKKLNQSRSNESKPKESKQSVKSTIQQTKQRNENVERTMQLIKEKKDNAQFKNNINRKFEQLFIKSKAMQEEMNRMKSEMNQLKAANELLLAEIEKSNDLVFKLNQLINESILIEPNN